MKKLFFTYFIVVSGVFAMPSERTLNLHFRRLDVVSDPHRMLDALSMGVTLQVYRGLLRYTPDGDVVPDLALSWKESNQGKKFVFKLRQATFSDGTPITSHHVVQSFARIYYLKAGIGADLSYIKGAPTFQKKLDLSKFGVKAVSTDTVEFTLNRPSSMFIKQIATADCGILPLKHFKDELPSGEKSIASGPYKIKSWGKEQIVLTKWRTDVLESGTPPTEVTIRSWKEGTLIPAAMEQKLDSLDDQEVEKKDIAQLSEKGWRPFVTEISREYYLILNPKNLSLDTRTELLSLINVDELMKHLEDYHRVAYGFVPDCVSGGLAKEEVPPFTGTKSSKIKEPIEVVYPAASKYMTRMAESLKRIWEKAGVKVTMTALPDKEYFPTIFEKKGKAVVLGAKSLEYPDAYSTLSYFRSDYSGNYFYVAGRTIDNLLSRAISESDELKRVPIYKEIQKEVLKKRTVFPLIFGSLASGYWGPKVKTVPPHPMGMHTLPLETIEMR